MAKRFFYVCAGLFLLAGAYALGSGSARAQSGAGVEAAEIIDPSYGRASAAIERQLYYLNGSGQTPQAVAPPVPGSSPIVACHSNGTDAYAILQSGEVWMFAPQSYPTWHLSATFPAGPTPAQQESFGSVKARYR